MNGLVAVDLDGTMLGDELALKRFSRELRRERFWLAYVTGRCLSSAVSVLPALPHPDFVIADVGGRICSGPGWEEDPTWRRRIAADWNPRRIEAVTQFFPTLRRQPGTHQGEFKMSYYLEQSEALPLLRDTLKRQRLRARLVYSSRRDLDIIPALSGKGCAVAHLAARLGFFPSQVFTCGDSENDLDMLCRGFCSAVVGNADPELLRQLPGDVYRSQAGYASGVSEALKHFGWL